MAGGPEAGEHYLVSPAAWCESGRRGESRCRFLHPPSLPQAHAANGAESGRPEQQRLYRRRNLRRVLTFDTRAAS